MRAGTQGAMLAMANSMSKNNKEEEKNYLPVGYRAIGSTYASYKAWKTNPKEKAKEVLGGLLVAGIMLAFIALIMW